MLHVRVVSPTAVTGQLAGTLGYRCWRPERGGAGGGCPPAGDAVQFDVRDEAANPVLGAQPSKRPVMPTATPVPGRDTGTGRGLLAAARSSISPLRRLATTGQTT